MQITIRDKSYKLIVLDFETFYGAGYTLRSMSTSGYVRDPRFKAHGIGVLTEHGNYQWLTNGFEENQFDWKHTAIICHNALFDAYILAHHYNIHPGFIIDTAGMSRLHFGVGYKHDLDTLNIRCGGKGKTLAASLANTKDKRNLTPEELHNLGVYCEEDCENTLTCFEHMYPYVPDMELMACDATIRMFTQSPLKVNEALAREEYDAQVNKKIEYTELAGVTNKQLASNQQFAELLLAMGVKPPTKISPRTGNETYAFALNDGGFQLMLEDSDPVLRTLCEARAAVKSSIHETRALRLIQEGADGKRLPVGLTYASAKTHRWGGTNKLNLQNLPRQGYLPTGKPDTTTGRLRRSIEVDDGYVLIVNDLSQIEVRMAAWWAGQLDLLEDFRNAVDIYKKMASRVFAKPIDQVSKQERFLGKCCLAEGTPVLTNSGYKPIETVTCNDKLWDGVEWVTHTGVIYNGIREVITHDSITGTPDHWCVSEHGNEIQIGEAASSMVRFMRSARADGTPIRVCPDRIPPHPPQKRVSLCGSDMLSVGDNQIDQQKRPELLQLRRSRDNVRLSDSTGSSSVGNPESRRTVDGSTTPQGAYQRVYDITNAGPRNCFTAGNGCLVFNCVLGLGYGMGASKLRLTLELGLLGGKVDITLTEAQQYVDIYRSTFSYIRNAWRICDIMVETMISGGKFTHNGVAATKNQLSFPNGTRIYYKGIHRNTQGEVMYHTRMGLSRLYGAILFENIVQKLARDVITEQLINIDAIPYLHTVTSTHDEITTCAKVEDADQGLADMQDIMNTAPLWCSTVPLASEGGYAQNYSK